MLAGGGARGEPEFFTEGPPAAEVPADLAERDAGALEEPLDGDAGPRVASAHPQEAVEDLLAGEGFLAAVLHGGGG